MIVARMTDGTYIIGIDANNVRMLISGMPMVINLTKMGGSDSLVVVYGETLNDIIASLEEAQGGPLPTAQPTPPEGMQ